jgi:hypothetical protein
MSLQILVYRSKPNPAGKDRAYGYPQQQQLLGEWVDLQNNGDVAVNLSILNLCHVQFSSQGVPEHKPTIYWTGKYGEVLNPGQILRVHTGRSGYIGNMAYDDAHGVYSHAFAEKGNFVLNNNYGDVVSVWWKGQDSEWNRGDAARYDSNPPEGAILRRVGDKLIP